MNEPRRVAEWFERNRRHLATAVALAACAVLGSELARHVPRDVEIRYDLGPDHAGVRNLEVEIVSADEEVLRSARFGYPGGAPRSLNDRVRLVPGTYEVRARLSGEAGETEVIRSIEVPSEGTIRLDLFDEATAAEPRRAGGALVATFARPARVTRGRVHSVARERMRSLEVRRRGAGS